MTISAPPEGPEVAHFLVPMDQVWNDVVNACKNQRLFCKEDCVQAWLASTGHPQGYVMDLATLWRLASDCYSGRLDSPYQRKIRPAPLVTSAQSACTAPSGACATNQLAG